jgi:hypothetical protein
VTVGRIVTAAFLVTWLAGCGTTPPSVSSATATTTAAATAPAATATTSSPPPHAVAVDPSLLGLLPPAVNGFAITESPEAETSAGQSPDLSVVATAFGAGLAADPTGNDWAFAVVVALRPDVMTDAAFRDWRDSYDEGACSQAGGVVGHAEAQIGGRTAYITSCGGGLRTYHVWLPTRQRLVSVSAVGERRFGEQLIAGIRG